MSPATHAHDQRLAKRLTELHKKMTWVAMSGRCGIDASTIKRAADGHGMEPQTYRKLMAEFCPELDLHGDEPIAVYQLNPELASELATKTPRISVSVECENFWQDEFGRLVIPNPCIVSTEIVGLG